MSVGDEQSRRRRPMVGVAGRGQMGVWKKPEEKPVDRPFVAPGTGEKLDAARGLAPMKAADFPMSPPSRTVEEISAAAPHELEAPKSHPLQQDFVQLLRDFKPTSPQHEQMRRQLIGADPGALAGFKGALESGGPEVDAAVKMIRELRGGRESMSTASAVPTGPAEEGGTWRNPGFEGWDESQVLPVGGGQFRDFNFGGYGNPIAQQQAEQMRQMDLLKYLGPEHAGQYLAAQANIEAMAPYRQATAEAAMRKADAQSRQADIAEAKAAYEMDPERRMEQRRNFAVSQDPSLFGRFPALAKEYGLPLMPDEELRAEMGLPAEAALPTPEQALMARIPFEKLLQSTIGPDITSRMEQIEKGYGPEQGFFSRQMEGIDPAMDEMARIARGISKAPEEQRPEWERLFRERKESKKKKG